MPDNFPGLDLGADDYKPEGNDDSFGLSKFLSKPSPRPYQPFGGQIQQTPQTFVQPQYYEQPQQTPAQQSFNVFSDDELDAYDKAKEDYKYINSYASSANQIASKRKSNYNDFMSNKLKPFFESVGGFGDFDDDDGYISALDEMEQNLLATSQQEDGWFGPSDDKIAAGDTLKGFQVWSSPNGLRDQYLRFKQERDHYTGIAETYKNDKIKRLEQLTNIPVPAKQVLDEELKARGKTPQGRLAEAAKSGRKSTSKNKDLNAYLDSFDFEEPMYSGFGLSNLDRTDPRVSVPIDNLSGSNQKRQAERLSAAMRGDTQGILSRREHIAKERKLRDKGILFSQSGLLDGRPIGMSRSDVDLLDIDDMKKMGIEEYRGVPIEQAFLALGGEERLQVAKVLEATRGAYLNYENAQIKWLAGNQDPGLKKNMDEAQEAFTKSLGLAAEFGLTDELVEQNEKKGFFARMGDSIDRGLQLNEMSKYASDFFFNAADQSDIEKFIQAATEFGEIPVGSASQKFQSYQSKGLWDSISNLLFENTSAIPELFMESMASFLPAYVRTGAKTIPTAAAVGALTPIPGGALGFAKTAARLNWGVASLVLEYSGMVLEGMQKLGIDWQNPKVFTAAWNNEAVREKIKDRALKKGVPIALFDAMSGMLAGRISGAMHHVGGSIKGGKLIDAAAWKRSQATAPKFTKFQRAGNAAADIAADATLGMAGEFVGQAWSKEPGEAWDTNAIAAEGIIGLGPGLAGAAYQVSPANKIDLSSTPFDYEEVKNTESGQTGVVNLAGFRNQFSSFNNAQGAAAHVINEGNYANAEQKKNATAVLTDLMSRFYALNPEAMSKLKLVVADRTPFADKEMEGSFHKDNETGTYAIYLNRNKIGQDPLGVFLHEAGHLARELMISQDQLMEIYEAVGVDAQKDAFSQYTLKVPDAKYSQLDESQKAQVDRAWNAKRMTPMVRAEEWFSYQWASLLAGRNVDSAVKTEYQNFLTKVIHPTIERFTGGETTGGSKEQQFSLNQLILGKMGFEPNGFSKDTGLSFGQYYHERPGMAQQFFAKETPIQQMGDEEALNSLMRKIKEIKGIQGEAQAKKIAEGVNKILGKKLLPTEMSAYTDTELGNVQENIVANRVSLGDDVATGEVYKTLKGEDAKRGVEQLLNKDSETKTENVVDVLDKDKRVESAKEGVKDSERAAQNLPKEKPVKDDSPEGVAREITARAKRGEAVVDQEDRVISSINEVQNLLPSAKIKESNGKFSLTTRLPGTRRSGPAQQFDTREAAEKAQKEFYAAEREKLKTVSEKVTAMSKLVLDQKAFEKRAEEAKEKLLDETNGQEGDISYGQIIAEIMDLNALQDSAIFSSALAGIGLADVSSLKAASAEMVRQAFVEYEQRVEFATGAISTRIAELERSKEAILNPEALGSAQSKNKSTAYKWRVVWQSPNKKWKKWENGKWVSVGDLGKIPMGPNKPMRNPMVKDQQLDAKVYGYVKKDKAAADKSLNEKQRRFIRFWREPQSDTKQATKAKAPAKTTPKAKQAEPKAKPEATKEEPKKPELTKEQKAELADINKKLKMLKQYLHAIEPEKTTIDWKDVPHFNYYKYVGPDDRPTKENGGFKKENFEKYTLGQLANSGRDTAIWHKSKGRWEEVGGVSDSQSYLFKYTNWRLWEGSKTQPKAKAKAQPAAGTDSERVNVTSVTKIISGGQTGADRAGLYAGRDLGIETGGLAPKGFKTESKSDETERLKGFGLTEVSDDITKAYTGREKTYGPRTEQNVLNSDGTVLFGDETSSGSKLTKNLASKHNKPYLANPTAEELRAWIAENDIKTLNVAGNRNSVNKKLFNTAKSTLVEALSDPKAETETKSPEPETAQIDEIQDKDGNVLLMDPTALGSGIDQSQAFNPFVNGRKLTDKLPWFGGKTVQEYVDMLDAVRASVAMPEGVGTNRYTDKDRLFFQSDKGTPVASMMLFRLREMDKKAGINYRDLVNGDIDRVMLSEMAVYELATGRGLEILDDRDFRGSKQQRYHQILELRASEIAKDIAEYEQLLEKTEDPKERARIERMLNGYDSDVEISGPKNSNKSVPANKPGKDVKGERIPGLRQKLAALYFDYDEIGAFQGEETGGYFAKIHGGKQWTETLTEFLFYKEKLDAIDKITDIWESDIAEDTGPGSRRKPDESKSEPGWSGGLSAWNKLTADERRVFIARELRKTEDVESAYQEAKKKFEELRDKAKAEFEESISEKTAEESTQLAKAWGANVVSPDEYEFFALGELDTQKVKAGNGHGSFARGSADQGIAVLDLYAASRADDFSPNRTTFGTGSGSEQMSPDIARSLENKRALALDRAIAEEFNSEKYQDIPAYEITKPDGNKLKVKRVKGLWKKGNGHSLPENLEARARDQFLIDNPEIENRARQKAALIDAQATSGISSGNSVSPVQFVEYLLSQIKTRKFNPKSDHALKKAVLSLQYEPSSEVDGDSYKQLPGGPGGGIVPYVWADFIKEAYKLLNIKEDPTFVASKDPKNSGWKNLSEEVRRTVTYKPIKLIQNPKTGNYSVSFETRAGKTVTRSLDTKSKKEAMALVKEANIEKIEISNKVGAEKGKSTQISETNTLWKNGVPDIDTAVKQVKPIIQAVYDAGRVRLADGRGFDETETSKNSSNATNILQRNPISNSVEDFIIEDAPEGVLDNTETDDGGFKGTQKEENESGESVDSTQIKKIEDINLNKPVSFRGPDFTLDPLNDKISQALSGTETNRKLFNLKKDGKALSLEKIMREFRTDEVFWNAFDMPMPPQPKKSGGSKVLSSLGLTREEVQQMTGQAKPDPTVAQWAKDLKQHPNYPKLKVRVMDPGTSSLSSGISDDSISATRMLTQLANMFGLGESGRQDLKNYFAKHKESFSKDGVIAAALDSARPSTRIISNALKDLGIEDKGLLDALDVKGLWQQYFGKTDEIVRQAHLRFIEPIEDALADHGIKNKQWGEYLIARAAPSKNDHIKKLYLEYLKDAKDEHKEAIQDMIDKNGDRMSGVSTELAIEVVQTMEKDKNFLAFLKDERNPLQKFYEFNREALRHRSANGLMKNDQDGGINEELAMVTASSSFNWKKQGGSAFMYQFNGADNAYSYAPMQGFEGETQTLFDNERAYEIGGKSSTAAGRAWDMPKHKFLFKGSFGRLGENAVAPDPKMVFPVAQSQYYEGAILGQKNTVSNAFGTAFEILRTVAYHGKEAVGDSLPLLDLNSIPGGKDILNKIEKDPTIIEAARELFEGKDAVFKKEFRRVDVKKHYEIKTEKLVVGDQKIDGLVMARREINKEFQNNLLVFTYRKEGEPFYIEMQNNERGMRFASSVKNLRYETLPKFLSGINALTRFMANMFTSKNPAFLIPNFFRDLQTAYIHLTEDDKKEFAKNVFSYKRLKGFMSGILNVEQRKARGEATLLDDFPTDRKEANEYAKKILANKDYEKMYQFAVQAGAKVGYFRNKPVTEMIEDLQKMQKKGKKNKKSERNILRHAVDTFDSMNTAVENTVRMSAFWSAIENGRTVHEAANISRNVTVDFNQKGTMTQTFGAFFVFFGASMNSMDRMIQTFHKRGLKGSRNLIGGIVLASMLVNLFNRLIDDDEEEDEPGYDRISSYRRDTNVLISMPGKENTGYVGIPLALGYNMFWTMGQTAMDVFAKYAMGRGGSGPMDFISRNMAASLNSFNPIGGAGLGTAFIPTPVKPFFELSANKNFMGAPIRMEDRPFEAPKPAHMMDPKRTQEHWTALSKSINEFMGGSDQVKGSFSGIFGSDPLKSLDDSDMKWDISGSQIEHLLLGYSGGPGQLLNAAFGGLLWPGLPGTSEDYGQFDANKMPITNRFYRSSTSNASTKNTYYQIRTANKTAERAVKAAKVAGPKEYAYTQQEMKDLLTLSSSVKYADALKSKIRAQKSKIESSKALNQDQKLQRIADLEKKEHAAYVAVIKKAQALGIS